MPSNSEQLRGEPLQLTGPIICQGEKVRLSGICADTHCERTATAHSNGVNTCMITERRNALCPEQKSLLGDLKKKLTKITVSANADAGSWNLNAKVLKPKAGLLLPRPCRAIDLTLLWMAQKTCLQLRSPHDTTAVYRACTCRCRSSLRFCGYR